MGSLLSFQSATASFEVGPSRTVTGAPTSSPEDLETPRFSTELHDRMFDTKTGEAGDNFLLRDDLGYESVWQKVSTYVVLDVNGLIK